MRKIRNLVPIAGVTEFPMRVLPAKDHLDRAIADNGFCRPDKCWHKVAISAIVTGWDPVGIHHVRVDAGHVKMNYKGFRYVADSPRHVKRSLMLFDKKRYDEVHIREYNLHFRRTTRVVNVTRKRQDAINANRRARIAAGGDEYRRNYDLRKRVEGFSSIV